MDDKSATVIPAAASGPGEASAFKPTRIEWVDAARGVGMLLVIVGHAIPKGFSPVSEGNRWIYSFHIPLFFFISGLLTKDNGQKPPWRGVVLKALRTVMLPYALFGAISFLAWLLVLRHLGHSAVTHLTPLPALTGLFYGVYDSSLGVLNAPLWFFPCLFCTLLLHRALPGGVLGELVAVLVLFMAGLAFARWLPWRLPWGLDIACVALLFMYAGQKLRPRLLGLSAAARMKSLLAVPFLLALGWVCAVHNERVNLAAAQTGNPAFFLVGAFAGILATLFVAPFLGERVFGSFLGRNTLIIFPLHMLCFSVITAAVIFVPALKRLTALSAAGTVAFYVVCTCLSFVAIIPLTKALFPWLMPAGRTRPVPVSGAGLPTASSR